LQIASYFGDRTVVEILIKEAANTNTIADPYGTALQATAHRGNEDVARLLLKHGPNLYAEGGKYGTAMNVALAAGHKDIVALFDRHEEERKHSHRPTSIRTAGLQPPHEGF